MSATISQYFNPTLQLTNSVALKAIKRDDSSTYRKVRVLGFLRFGTEGALLKPEAPETAVRADTIHAWPEDWFAPALVYVVLFGSLESVVGI